MGLRISKEQYELLRGALEDFLHNPATEELPISGFDMIGLRNADRTADAFERDPNLAAKAYLILSGFRLNPSQEADTLLDALYPIASKSEYWRRHAVGPSGIFGRLEAFTGRRLGKTAVAPVKIPPVAANYIGGGFRVISNESKFVIPLGILPDAVPLIYPEGHEKAGKPFVDLKGRPLPWYGMVFFNHADGAYQAVPQGHGAIIFNNVMPEQAEQLYEKIAEFADDPRKLTRRQLMQVLDFAESLGLEDRYGCDNYNLKSQMIKARETDVKGSVEKTYGFMDWTAEAVYIPEPFVFGGGNVPLRYMPNGGFFVRVAGKTYAVSPEKFLETYRHLDGGKIELGNATFLTMGRKFRPSGRFYDGKPYYIVQLKDGVEVILKPRGRYEDTVSVDVVRSDGKALTRPFKLPVVVAGGKLIPLFEDKMQGRWSGVASVHSYGPSEVATPVVVLDDGPVVRGGSYIAKWPAVLGEAKTNAEVDFRYYIRGFEHGVGDYVSIRTFVEKVRRFLSVTLQHPPTDAEIVHFLTATGEGSLQHLLGMEPRVIRASVEKVITSGVIPRGEHGEVLGERGKRTLAPKEVSRPFIGR